MNRRTDRAVGAVGFLVAIVALRLLMAGRHSGPFVTDEAGYLGNARWLAGTGGRWLMDTSPYYRWGYSVLIAPIQWLTDDPSDQFQLVVWVNLVLLGALFPVLYSLLRRTLDAPVWVAAVAAGVAVAYPGVGVSSGMAMAENLLVPLFALSVLSFLSFAQREGRLGWWFGFFVLGLWASHRRVALVVAVALAAIAVAVWADRRRLTAGLVNAGVLLVGLVPVTVIDHVLVEERWLRIRRPEEFSGGPGTLLTSPGEWVTFLERLVGQAWYLVAGSLGLVAFGVVCLLQLRSADEGPPEGTGRLAGVRRRAADPIALTAWFQLGALVAMAAITSVFFTLVTMRPDQRVYGRYTDMVVPPVLAAGVVWVLTRPWRQVVAAAAAALVVLGGTAFVLLAPNGRAPFAGAYPINQVAAIAWLDPNTKVPVFEATLLAGAALVVLALLSRVKAVPLVLAGIVVVYAMAVHPVQERILKGQGYRNGYRTFPMQVDRVGDVDRFAFAIDQQSRGEATVIQWWLPGATMVPWGAGEPPPEPWAIAPIDSQRAIDAGGRQVFRDVRVHSALWVMPGPEQDRMAEEGRLLAEDPRAPLPPSARRGRITSDTGSLTAAPGEHLDLDVQVRNDGDQPWLDFESYRGTGVVRLGARWLAEPAGGGPPTRVDHANVRGDLPATLWPGESADVTVPLDLVDLAGTPFAPGRYQLEIVVVQEGLGVIEEIPALTIPVEVT